MPESLTNSDLPSNTRFNSLPLSVVTVASSSAIRCRVTPETLLEPSVALNILSSNDLPLRPSPSSITYFTADQPGASAVAKCRSREWASSSESSHPLITSNTCCLATASSLSMGVNVLATKRPDGSCICPSGLSSLSPSCARTNRVRHISSTACAFCATMKSKLLSSESVANRMLNCWVPSLRIWSLLSRSHIVRSGSGGTSYSPVS